MRLSVMERELAKWFSLPDQPAVRRRRLTKKEVEAFVIDGYREYLYDLADLAGHSGEEREKAESLLAESTSVPEGQLAQSALQWAQELLTKRNGSHGERMFRRLRARSPGEIGRSYAVYRAFGNEDWSWERLVEEYEWTRRE
jgi:hypothetical protein